MRREKRHHFILLELLIAMTLAMAIMSTLTYLYWEISEINRKMDESQNRQFSLLYLDSRLETVLTHAINAKDKDLEFHFFSSRPIPGLTHSSSDILTFTFDNGVRLDKDQSYVVIGRLFVDTEGNLTLAIIPREKAWGDQMPPPLAKELLFEGVESLKLSYFVLPAPPKPQTIPVAGGATPNQSNPNQANGTQADFNGAYKEPSPLEQYRGKWISYWEMNYRELPGMIAIEMSVKGPDGSTQIHRFAYPFPLSKQPIFFQE